MQTPHLFCQEIRRNDSEADLMLDMSHFEFIGVQDGLTSREATLNCRVGRHFEPTHET
jgi:hypothetical protein